MAAYTSRKITSQRVEFVLPVPSVGAELCKAYEAAQRSYEDSHDLPTHVSMPADALTITVTDNEVVISYTVETAAAR